MRVRAIVQARMLSSRLRGKSLMAVNGIPLLYRVIRRIKALNFIHEIMIATTSDFADDPIEAAAKELNVLCYRGSSLDVLKRYTYASSDLQEDDLILRYTADNPVYDPDISMQVYHDFIDSNLDYLAIDGLSHIIPEFIKVRSLRTIDKLAVTNFDREHVTPLIRRMQKDFKIKLLDSNYKGLRKDLDSFLTIDNPEQLHIFDRMLIDIEKDKNIIDRNTIYKWIDNNILPYQNRESSFNSKTINLGGIKVGDGQPTFIIAEIGQNHNGNIEIAKQLIDMATSCKANAVKFQKRDIDSELTKEAFNQPYDNSNSFGKTYGEHRIFLELSEEQHAELKQYAESQNLIYFCTPCDIPSLEAMERIGCPFYKVASRDLTNLPLLQAMSKLDKPVIISTGMADITDIEDAITALKPNNNIAIMKCTSQYPTELEYVNLKGMITLKDKFGYWVGLSDHTSGIIASVSASVMGASLVEKHITLSRAMKGSDQAGSLEKQGLYKLVDYIRASERVMGDSEISYNPIVENAKIKLARSITSKFDISKGQTINEEMITLKSPGNGIKWRDKNLIVGKKAIREIAADVTIMLEDVEDEEN